MTAEAWITLAVVLAVLVVLIRDLLPPSGAMVAGVAVLLGTKVIDPAQAFEGFSNPAPITIAGLYVLAKAVQKTGALTPIVRSVLGDGVHRSRSVARLMIPTALASGVFNNTPIVAMLVSPIQRWADQRGQSVSRYLMPLSFAAILGGTLTVIGTSTNVVVSGLMESAGLEPIGFFEMTKIGAPVAVIGVAIVVLLAARLLPDRTSARADAQDEARQFTLDMLVDSGGPLDGKTVESAGLRHLVGVFLASLERDGEEIAPVAPTTILRGADRLRFVGKADLVVDLTTLPGISSLELTATDPPDTRRPGYYQAVIGASSPLVGRTLKEIGFRGRYQAVVLAIHRAGQRIDAKLGDVQLRVGDTLLLLSDPGFAARWTDRNDFLLISGTGDAPHGSTGTVVTTAAVTVGIIVSAATGFFPLVTAALLGSAALVVLRILTPGEARDAVDLDVVITIAAAFGLANALVTSGLAQVAADGLVNAFDRFGSRGVLLGIVLATVLVTEMITNNAAALLIFPIATAAAAAGGLDVRGAAIAVAAMASASFLTPIGYQTNTMVYGPGGYRFTDYVRLGFPLTIAVMALTVALVPILWPVP